jgi:hypothetical protein
LDTIPTAGGVLAAAPALWNRIQTKLHDVQRSIVEQLHQHNALARGLDIDTATDILWTLNHPALWQLLVRERGWSPEQYERWLGDSFCSQLLQDVTPRP